MFHFQCSLVHNGYLPGVNQYWWCYQGSPSCKGVHISVCSFPNATAIVLTNNYHSVILQALWTIVEDHCWESLQQQPTSQVSFYTSAIFHWRCISPQRKPHPPGYQHMNPRSSLSFSSARNQEAHALALSRSQLLSVDMRCVFCHLTKEQDAVGQPFCQQCKVLEITVQGAESCELWHTWVNFSAGQGSAGSALSQAAFLQTSQPPSQHN